MLNWDRDAKFKNIVSKQNINLTLLVVFNKNDKKYSIGIYLVFFKY